MKLFLNIFLWIWQLPQHLLGLFLIFIFRGKRTGEYYRIKTPDWWGFGVSLGNYIMFSEEYCHFFDRYQWYETETVGHEKGHSVQSRMLGPLYLFSVGFVSGLQNLICRFIPNSKYTRDYYKRWPENWADKISGIIRKD